MHQAITLVEATVALAHSHPRIMAVALFLAFVAFCAIIKPITDRH